ncbi:hypothetical protein Angca_000038 [Angiostrongylus cantonensis]|nr:hypothetical protein Angca_000038 [Angiostrongylus cantonensis]
MIVSLVVLVALLPHSARVLVGAIPRRGNEPWSLVLCKFKDSDYEPRTAEWFSEWISGGNNPDTIENYFSSVSNTIYTIKGSNVTKWLRLPWTRHEVLRMALMDPRLQSVRDRPFAMFDKAKQLCISFAEQNGFTLHRRKITVINMENTAVYSKDTGKVYALLPSLFSNAVANGAYNHCATRALLRYERKIGASSELQIRDTLTEGLSAIYHTNQCPFLSASFVHDINAISNHPRKSIYNYSDGRTNYTLRLSSLSVPHRLTNGWLLVMIPYDRDDPGNVYTIEHRTPVGNDMAIKQGAVVVHKVHRIGQSYYSTLITHEHGEFDELTAGTEWLRFLNTNIDGSFQYIRVKVERVNGKSHSADLKIITTFQPEVCHGKEVRIPIQTSLSLISRGVRSVCIERNRTITQNDVDRQYLRQAFFGLRRTFGQNECVSGYTWRAIDAYDYVCVEPHRVAEVMESIASVDENGAGCDVDYVQRNAFQGDKACVSDDERALIHKENAESHLFLRNNAFFNGADSVGP